MNNKGDLKTGVKVAQITTNGKNIYDKEIDKKTVITDLHTLEQMFDNNTPMFIEFYMNGCGPCQATAPKWEEMIHSAKTEFKNTDLVIVSIESNMLSILNKNKKFKEIANGVNAFPTIGIVINKKFINYEGNNAPRERSAVNFINFVKENLPKSGGGINFFKSHFSPVNNISSHSASNSPYLHRRRVRRTRKHHKGTYNGKSRRRRHRNKNTHRRRKY